MAAAAAIMDIVTKCFCNSESPCHPNASHQDLTQSDFTIREQMRFEDFKMATLGAISDIGLEQFQQF